MHLSTMLPTSMKALRALVLLLCLAPLWLAIGLSHAAQPTGKAPTAHAQATSAKPVRKKALAKSVIQPLPTPKLDLSLPASLVENLEPEVGDPVARRKPLLPSMFPQKPISDDSPFQLNGRLINNEMQLRNDSRHDVEGAAIDFEFRQ